MSTAPIPHLDALRLEEVIGLEEMTILAIIPAIHLAMTKRTIFTKLNRGSGTCPTNQKMSALKSSGKQCLLDFHY
jgi:hypothetical protein